MDLEVVLAELTVAVGAVSASTRAEVQVGLSALARVAAMCEHLGLRLTARLTELSSSPEDDVAATARMSRKQAKRQVGRAKTAANAPEFTAAMAGGSVSGEHLDELSHALARLQPAERSKLLARESDLARAARHCTPEELRDVLDRAVADVRTDDGMRRLEQQRRNTRLRTWTRRSDGMFCMYGQFDPESGLKINAVLEAQLRAKFAEPLPEEAPVDAAERNAFLRARGFMSLLDGGAGVGTAELVIVADTRQTDPDGRPVWNLGLDVDLPASVIADLVRDAKVWPVILSDGALAACDGAMNLGRSERLASKPQRRVLQALYPTCPVPGCTAPFSRTKIHHTIEWEYHGTTDLELLVPLCPQHHGDVHAGRISLVVQHPKVTVTYHHPEARPPPGEAAA